jgi:hypothetical protein
LRLYRGVAPVRANYDTDRRGLIIAAQLCRLNRLSARTARKQRGISASLFDLTPAQPGLAAEAGE